MMKRKHYNFDDVVVPIPLRHDLVIRIANIPLDLTEAEARKIAAVVLAHAGPPRVPGDA
jgi:hypothetical protein